MTTPGQARRRRNNEPTRSFPNEVTNLRVLRTLSFYVRNNVRSMFVRPYCI